MVWEKLKISLKMEPNLTRWPPGTLQFLHCRVSLCLWYVYLEISMFLFWVGAGIFCKVCFQALESIADCLVESWALPRKENELYQSVAPRVKWFSFLCDASLWSGGRLLSSCSSSDAKKSIKPPVISQNRAGSFTFKTQLHPVCYLIWERRKDKTMIV